MHPLRYAFAVLLPLAGAAPPLAQTAYFDDSTDTIQVDGQTEIGMACTYETVVRFPAGGGAGGMLVNEWTNALEDKQFFFAYNPTGPSILVGYNFPAGDALQDTVAVTPDAWHHVAFVYDGAEERLYMDGVLLAARPMGITVGNSGGLAHVGAIDRGGTVIPSVTGYLESLRLSDVARYTGATYTPTYGDFASDDDTVLLFNFDEPAGSPTVQDESPLGRTGTLGVGFVGATAPRLGPLEVATEPGAVPPSAVLHEAMPNPAFGYATLRYDLPEAGRVRLVVYDLLGRTVAVLVDGVQAAGQHKAVLDGAPLASGTYLVRMTAPHGFTQTQRLTLLR